MEPPNHLKSMKNTIGIRTGSRADPNSPPGRPGGATAVPRDPCATHGGTDPGSGNPVPLNPKYDFWFLRKSDKEKINILKSMPEATQNDTETNGNAFREFTQNRRKY